MPAPADTGLPANRARDRPAMLSTLDGVAPRPASEVAADRASAAGRCRTAVRDAPARGARSPSRRSATVSAGAALSAGRTASSRRASMPWRTARRASSWPRCCRGRSPAPGAPRGRHRRYGSGERRARQSRRESAPSPDRPARHARRRPAPRPAALAPRGAVPAGTRSTLFSVDAPGVPAGCRAARCGRRALDRCALCGRCRSDRQREQAQRRTKANAHWRRFFHSRPRATSRSRRGPKVLLVRLRLIGDVVFTTPAIRAIRRGPARRPLTYLVEPGRRRLSATTRISTRCASCPSSGVGVASSATCAWVARCVASGSTSCSTFTADLARPG